MLRHGRTGSGVLKLWISKRPAIASGLRTYTRLRRPYEMDRLVRQHLEAYALLAHISDVLLGRRQATETRFQGTQLLALLFNDKRFRRGFSIDPTNVNPPSLEWNSLRSFLACPAGDISATSTSVCGGRPARSLSLAYGWGSPRKAVSTFRLERK